MLGFFESLFKLLKFEKITTDNVVFRMHYKLTFPGLVLFSLMLTSTQYFGNPIDCTVQGVENKGLVNTFCWTHGTYTVQNKPGVTNRPPSKEELDQMEEHGIFGFAQPGMQTFNPAINERKFYYFYQWVSFVLFLQGCCFYFPRFLWKKLMENGKMKFLTSGTKELTLCPEEKSDRATRLTLSYFKLKGKNGTYASGFFFMEILNLFNVCVQIFLTDLFLQGEFLNYGTRVAYHVRDFEIGDNWNWNPMDVAFPKMSKCQFNKHGVGGGIQNHDAMCLLPLNIVNEKIYLVLWWWYIVLAVCSALAVIYRTACFMFPEFRVFMLWKPHNNWTMVANICRNRPYGDWFLLRQMVKNVEEDTFEDFLYLLCKDDKFRDCEGTNKRTDWFKTLRRPGQGANPVNPATFSNSSLDTQETGFSEENNNNNNIVNNNRAEMD